MARQINFTKENLLELLPKDRQISPEMLKKAALKLLSMVNTSQKSITHVQFGVALQIADTVRTLEAEGRINLDRKQAYFDVYRADFRKKAPIAIEFRQAESKLIPEENLLADIKKWQKEFEIFGSGSENEDDVKKAITVVRELQSVHDHRPFFTKIKNALGGSTEQDAITALAKRLAASHLIRRDALIEALSADHNPVYNIKRLSMPNPGHMACMEEIFDRLKPQGADSDDFASLLESSAPTNQTTPSAEKSTKAPEEAPEKKDEAKAAEQPKVSIETHEAPIVANTVATAENIPEKEEIPEEIPTVLEETPAKAESNSEEEPKNTAETPVKVQAKAETAEFVPGNEPAKEESKEEPEPHLAEETPAKAEMPEAADTVKTAPEAEELPADEPKTTVETPANEESAENATEAEELPADESKTSVETPANEESKENVTETEELSTEETTISQTDVPEAKPDEKSVAAALVNTLYQIEESKEAEEEDEDENDETGSEKGEEVLPDEEMIVPVHDEQPMDNVTEKSFFAEGWNLTVAREPDNYEARSVKTPVTSRSNEEIELKKRLMADEENLVNSFTYKRILAMELFEPYNFTMEETARIARASTEEAIRMTLKKTKEMTEGEKSVFFDAIKDANKTLYTLLCRFDRS